VLNDVSVLNAPIAVDIKLVFNVIVVIMNLNDALDFEHIDE
jgi:hypothetical protein